MIPTAEDLIQHHLLEMRAPLKRRTVFTPAGRQVVRSTGERTIKLPDGTLVKVVEYVEGGNQIEHDDVLHAVVRPAPVQVTMTVKGI